MKSTLSNRLFNFSLNTLKLLKLLPYDENMRVIRNQLIKSSTSISANYEESQTWLTRNEFTNTIKICLKESRETIYWLKLIDGLYNLSSSQRKQINLIIKESIEIKKILASIYNKLKKVPNS